METTRFDSADYLNTADDVAAYLDAYLEDGSPDEIRAALSTIARSRGITELATLTGMTRSGLYKALGSGGNPSFETIRSILSAIGLRFAVTPVQKELEGD